MRAEVPRAILEVHYEAAAEEYLRKLKPENHMEATPQATQREITLASLALVHERRPEVQFFNELLVQYAVGNRRSPARSCRTTWSSCIPSRSTPSATTRWRSSPRSRSG